MARKKKENGVNPKLLKYLDKLLDETMKDQTASLTDKMKVVDRVIGVEKIRLKVADEGEGGFFRNPQAQEPDDEGAPTNEDE
jgi:hypothetical protein